MVWFYAILSVVIISLVSLIGAFTLSLKPEKLNRLVFILVSLSVGALFGDVFIHLIPEALAEGISSLTFSLSIITGVMVFFILEKFLRWHHSHGAHVDCPECHPNLTEEHHEEIHEKSHLGPMILLGDSFHNFLDGIIIGLSFLVSIPIGLATTVAVILHEIPQEISDFGILIHSGYSRARALLWNFLSASAAILGVIIALLVGKTLEEIIPIGIAFAAGGFIYIAGSDLVPELHKTKELKKSLLQVLAISIGFLFMFLLFFFE